MSYKLSGDEKFLDVAKKHMPTYKERLDNEIGIHDHDVGFVYSPSCVGMYKLFVDDFAKEIVLRAAYFLYDHSYFEKGGFIMRISEKPDNMACCRTMMDTLMNIALLYWAGKITGDKKFTDAANAQIKTTDECLIRPDSSSYHHYQFEPGSLKPLYGVTFQGNRNESTWSRGHSWGVLGLPIAYTYSGNKDLVTLHRNVTYYFLNNLPDDLIPYWDFDYIEGDEPRDSSAAAIAVICICGFVILFGAITAYIEFFSMKLSLLKPLVYISEVTTAISKTNNIYLISFLLGFSGISIWCQVLAVGKAIEINIFSFAFHRLIHGAVSATLTFLILRIFPVELTTFSNTDLVKPVTFVSGEALGISILILGAVFIISLTNRQKSTKILEELI